jgi:4-hydroxy-3-methylbut-2-enyl diphosphate reductase
MEAIRADVKREYHSKLLERILASGGEFECDGLTVRLPRKFGFCYGVQRAIDMAFATRKMFPQANIYLLGEIIHNPVVNDRFRQMGIHFLSGAFCDSTMESVSAEDIVIVPAFGAPVDAMESLARIGCRVVDTTCGDVMSVWKHVRRFATAEITSVIHGQLRHEETIGTISQTHTVPDAHFVVVENLRIADVLCEFLTGRAGVRALLDALHGSHSAGFEPTRHLRRVGMANQTTMLSRETEEIQRRLRAAVGARDGHTENFFAFEGICRATQERQDALLQLFDGTLDLLLVVGGYNSSNTTHLVEIGEANVPTYFLRDAAALVSVEQIRHFDIHERQERATEGWLPATTSCVGIASGASCPDSLLSEVIHRLFALRGVNVS